MTRRKRTRRVMGLIPRLGRGLGTLGWWVIRHPQPAIGCGLLVVALAALGAYAQRADAFRITAVHLPPQSSLRLRTPLIGENLWEVDLRAVADSLKAQQPWLKDVRVIRELPNAIRIETIPRLPVAQVRVDRWYPVDQSGFILPDGRADADTRLVRLVGFEHGGTALRAGKENRDDRLQLALRVLATVRRAPPFVSRRLTQINVADPQQIRFVIADETEIRCGAEEELQTHLSRLRAALRAMAKRPLAAAYIDVRFQDPVIGPRT